MMRLVALLLLVSGATALQVPACSVSRLAASRVAPRAALCMCDGEAAEAAVPEAAPEPVAEVAAEEAPKPAPKGKANKTPIDQLVVGSEVEGKIRSVMAYGAFVDIGAQTDGLLHVSEISNEFVQDANDKLTVGESVTCRIKSVNLEKGQLALSCKDESAAAAERGPSRGKRTRPDLSEYENVDKTAFVSGKVNSITEYGAFVTLKEGVDGLLHISAIQEGGVGKVEDVLSQGQEVQVRVVSFDKAKRRIGLSMKPYVEGEENKARERGPRGRRESAYGDESEFKLNEEELEALTVADEDFGADSSFASAFARQALVQTAKAEKKKYSAQVL